MFGMRTEQTLRKMEHRYRDAACWPRWRLLPGSALPALHTRIRMIAMARGAAVITIGVTGITEPFTTVTASAVRRIGSNGMPMQARHFESRWQWSSPPTIQTPYTNGVACSRFHNAATRITSTRTGFGTHAIKTTILSTTGTVPTGRPRRDASRSIIHS